MNYLWGSSTLVCMSPIGQSAVRNLAEGKRLQCCMDADTDCKGMVGQIEALFLNICPEMSCVCHGTACAIPDAGTDCCASALPATLSSDGELASWSTA